MERLSQRKGLGRGGDRLREREAADSGHRGRECKQTELARPWQRGPAPRGRCQLRRSVQFLPSSEISEVRIALRYVHKMSQPLSPCGQRRSSAARLPVGVPRGEVRQGLVQLGSQLLPWEVHVSGADCRGVQVKGHGVYPEQEGERGGDRNSEDDGYLRQCASRLLASAFWSADR